MPITPDHIIIVADPEANPPVVPDALPVAMAKINDFMDETAGVVEDLESVLDPLLPGRVTDLEAAADALDGRLDTAESDIGGLGTALASKADAAATAAALSGKISHSLATAANDFLVASGAGAFVKKTLAEVKTLLGFGAASGVATLDANSKVIQDPASAAATPAANKIPIADANALLNNWITPMEMMGGTLQYVSATTIKWAFIKSNQIRVFDHSNSRQAFVQCASEPTLSSTANDMNGDAMTYDIIYDVFAKFESPTSISLHVAQWASSAAGSSARTAAWVTSTAYKVGQRVSNAGNYYPCLVAHTSGTFATDLANGKWGPAMTGASALLGLDILDGCAVYSNIGAWRGYRFLGIVMTINSSGSKFAWSQNRRLIANWHNQKSLTGSGEADGGGTTTTSQSYVLWPNAVSPMVATLIVDSQDISIQQDRGATNNPTNGNRAGSAVYSDGSAGTALYNSTGNGATSTADGSRQNRAAGIGYHTYDLYWRNVDGTSTITAWLGRIFVNYSG